MESIQILPENVVDQIAAGEVVERPAHLVKELVENSIDAGATCVQVDFSLGGQQVKVSDDGRGIPSSEMSLAFARHATSKIRNSEDLWHLSSFGFRGEALASVSAVSKVKLVSKTPSADTAYSIEGEFGRLGSVEGSGGGLGTTIWIDDLFGNVPARKKFLKSDSAESTQIKNVLKAMGLSHEKVEFRVLQNGKLEFLWKSCASKKERIKQILGVENLYEGFAEFQGIKAKVFVGPPHETVKSRKNIWLFAQGRWVQDKNLQAAVMEAYRGLLMHHEYPTAIVYVETPPEEIDVNVHPTKSQVKFREVSHAFRAVQRAIRGILEQAPWLDVMLGTGSGAKGRQPVSKHLDGGEHSAKAASSKEETNYNFSTPEFFNTQWKQKETHFPATKMTPVNRIEERVLRQQGQYINTNECTGLGSDEKISSNKNSEGLFDEPSDGNKLTKSNWSQLQVLGQAAQTYILTQSSTSLIVVDQHAAHERVVYEQLMSSWKNGNIDVQNLLIPIEISMSPDKLEGILSLQAELLRMGVEVESLGPESLAVSTLPLILKESSVVQAIEKMGRELVEQGGSYAIETALSNMAATMACHSVVRAGQALSIEEMRSLLQAMDEFPLSSFCPHGRPVFIEIPFGKLERDFGRII